MLSIFIQMKCSFTLKWSCSINIYTTEVLLFCFEVELFYQYLYKWSSTPFCFVVEFILSMFIQMKYFCFVLMFWHCSINMKYFFALKWSSSQCNHVGLLFTTERAEKGQLLLYLTCLPHMALIDMLMALKYIYICHSFNKQDEEFSGNLAAVCLLFLLKVTCI